MADDGILDIEKRRKAGEKVEENQNLELSEREL